MPRLVPAQTSNRLYPKHDSRRVTGVIVSVDHESGSGFIRYNDQDLVFFREEALGDFDTFQQGRTVTFLPVTDHLGTLPTVICNIHDDTSRAALIAHQSAVYA